MLKDDHNRIISYLRVSITERCNFRCAYCAPVDDQAAERGELLTFEEICRAVRVGARLGLTKVRLTGGEPTVRRDVVKLVRMLAAIPGIGDLAMTTNASRLEELADALKSAGLRRVNISLDSTRRERVNRIAGRDCFEAVMRGIEAAIRADFESIKFNCVVMRGVNDDELIDLTAFAHERGATMRFIEFMPMGALVAERRKIVEMPEMLRNLNKQFAFEQGREDRAGDGAAADPARTFVCRKTNARVGFIASMSNHFCASCNRMRLTATGGLRPCLHQNAEVDLRRILRDGASDKEIVAAFEQAASLKWAGHQMNAFVPLYSRKQMIAVGG